MKTAQKSFDLVKSTKNRTIDLAEVLGTSSMDPIEGTIKIRIEKILTKNEGIHEIPVKIKHDIEEIFSFDQIIDLVNYNLATKSELRYFKKISSFFSL